jgi:hypothetical protein
VLARRGRLAFQVPLVDGFTSDYAAAPVSPGLFEQVSDRGMPCGVPVAEWDGTRWLPLVGPTDVTHHPGGLAWTNPAWVHWTDWDWWKGRREQAGSRQAEVRVEDQTLVGHEVWTFPKVPDAVGIWFGESETPLSVTWEVDQPFQASTVAVDGMADWCSHWGPIRRLHQCDMRPARRMEVRYRLSPAL